MGMVPLSKENRTSSEGSMGWVSGPNDPTCGTSTTAQIWTFWGHKGNLEITLYLMKPWRGVLWALRCQAPSHSLLQKLQGWPSCAMALLVLILCNKGTVRSIEICIKMNLNVSGGQKTFESQS